MTKHLSYGGPGRFVAICNKTNFDGHYAKVFDIPEQEDKELSASWFFLNVVDGTACLEAVYPLSVFESLGVALIPT